MDLNSDEIQCFQRLSLTNCRVCFRYRSRSTAMVKMNQKGKRSYECLTCRFCNSNVLETQEHLEICEGTKFERRGLRLSDVMGRVIYWRKMTVKIMTQMATATSIPEVHLPDAPCGGSPIYCGCSHVYLVRNYKSKLQKTWIISGINETNTFHAFAT